MNLNNITLKTQEALPEPTQEELEATAAFQKRSDLQAIHD